MGSHALMQKIPAAGKGAFIMRIMGVDPGYAIVGIGLLDYDNVRFSLVEYGAITTPAELPFETRLRQIYDDMTELLTRYRPDAVAMEQLFFTSNRTTGSGVQLHAASGKIGGGGLRQSRKGTGDGNDPPPFAPQSSPPAR